MGTPMTTVLVEIDDRRADDGDPRLGLDAGDLPLDSIGARDVVGVEPRHVLAGCVVQRAIQRGGETEPHVVPEHPDSSIVEAFDGLVGRVVDDDELEVAERLREHTADGFAEEARVVVRREQNGDERHGR